MTPLPTLAAAVWPALVGALAILYANIGDGAWARRSAIAWMMGSWGARLTVQMLYTRLVRRPKSGRPEGLRYNETGRPESPRYNETGRPESPRYNETGRPESPRHNETGRPESPRYNETGRPESPRHNETGRPEGLRYVVWAASVLLFSLPALIASRNPDPNLSVTELAACGLWILAFAGETTADRQLVRFTAKPENAGLACRTGLWRYSPHAHALFEGLIWIAFALFASASPWGSIAFACPLARVVLLSIGCEDDFSAVRAGPNADETPMAR